MTGYGSAEGQLHGVTYTAEIKTVNNRFFKTIIKLPDQTAYLEEDIERLLRGSIERGMVNYTLRTAGIGSESALEINAPAVKACATKLKQLGTEAGADYTIDMSQLLLLPGMLLPLVPSDAEAQAIKDKVLKLTGEAIEELTKMRNTEGEALATDLKDCCDIVRQGLEKIKSRERTAKKEYQERLQRRVNELLASAQISLDETTLAREVAVFAERSDISEEISRLNSHLAQFEDICENQGGPAGRRLDFLAQELLREANTIGSKSSDLEISHWVVDIKCQIDRIKEQVQNIE